MAYQSPDLSRRGLLMGAAALSLAGCCPVWASNIDVVVIGAGAAGIAAAQMLAALGRSFVVVEADNRIGGRAFTDTRTFGMPFDIGCAWIHAAHSNPFYSFALEHGFHVQYHDLSLNEIYYGSKRQTAGFVDDENKAEFMIGEAIDATAKEGKDVAAASVLPTRAPPMDAAVTYVGPMDAAVDLDRESVFDHVAESEAEYDPNYLVREGFGALVARVGKDVRVRLSTPVQAVRYDGQGVSVQTRHGTIAAKAAIVTVSTGVLDRDLIAFTPALPARTRDAIASLPMGLLTKVPLLIPGIGHEDFGLKPYDNVLEENPAGEDDFYFLAWPWNTDLMVGFVGGRYAWELAKRPDAEVIDLAKQSLVEMFGSGIAAKVSKGLVTPWAKNPLTLGAYSAELPGHHDARAALRQPVADRVFFAGEVVAENGLFATCGGAYLSGQSVAREVHRILG